MRKLKIFLTLAVALIIAFNTNTSWALSMNAQDVKVKKDEEFTVVMDLDEEVYAFQAAIKFDSSKLEFVKASDSLAYTNIDENGILRYVYFGVDGSDITQMKATKKIELTFKAKEEKKSEISVEEVVAYTADKKEINSTDFGGKTKIKVSPKSGVTRNIIIIVSAIAVVIVAGAVIMKVKKSK